MSGGGKIATEATKKARDEFTKFVIEQLLRAGSAASDRGLTPAEQRQLTAVGMIVVDLSFYIMDELASGKTPTIQSIVKQKLKMTKRVGQFTESETLLCGTAVVDFAFKLVTLYPAMVAGTNAAIVATGIGAATGGAGLIFAAGAWGSVAIAALLLYSSASDVGVQCSAFAEKRWLSGEIPGATAMRPALSLPMQTKLIFTHLEEVRRQGPTCEARATF